jgi:predicted dehydrogenase
VSGGAGPLPADSLHVGLMGAGVMGGTHLRGWLELGAQVSIVSDDGMAEALAAEDTTRRVEARRSLGELVEHCSVIDICTPTFTHEQIAVAATEAGRPVVCEKPLALGVAGAERMLAAAARAGVGLFPGHVVRYFPEYEVMASAVASGAVGPPAVVRLNRTGSYPTRSAWFSDPDRSGGILMDQMVHDFDMARLVAGDVASVHAVLSTDTAAAAHPAAAATVILTHVAGAVTHVRGVWGPPSTPFHTGFRVAGPGGVLEHDSRQQPAFRVVTGSEDQGILPALGLSESPYVRQLREFAVALTGGPPPRVSARDGVEAVRIANAAQRSAATGEAVALDRAGGSRAESDDAGGTHAGGDRTEVRP